MNIYSKKLANNLPVIGINTETFGSVSLLVLVKVGSRYEDDQMAGISHFLEHAVSKSIPSFPTPFKLAAQIEGIGGISNAFTSREYMGFWIKLPTEHFKVATQILYETVTQPLLKADEIEREKGVIVEEINMYEDDPQRKIGDLYEEQLYPHSSLGRDIAGTKETVKSFVRHDFVTWLKRYFHPNNALVAVAGNLGTGKLFDHYMEMVETGFAPWGKGELYAPKKFVDGQTGPVIKAYQKDTQQAHLALGYRAFSYFDQRRYTLSVLSRLLGGGMSSRLFDEVREKRGLCYYIYTTKDHYADVGHMTTYAGVSTDVKKIRETLSATLAEHAKIAQGKVTDEEVRRVKDMIKGHILLSLEDSYSVAQFFAGEQLLSGSYRTPEEIIACIEKVTKQEVIELAHELFVPKNLNIAVLGPVTKKELELGEIVG